MTPNIYCLLGIKLRAKENELKEKKMQRMKNKANNFIEKRNKRITLDLTILLDRITIRPGRDLTPKKVDFEVSINK